MGHSRNIFKPWQILSLFATCSHGMVHLQLALPLGRWPLLLVNIFIFSACVASTWILGSWCVFAPLFDVISARSRCNVLCLHFLPSWQRQAFYYNWKPFRSNVFSVWKLPICLWLFFLPLSHSPGFVSRSCWFPPQCQPILTHSSVLIRAFLLSWSPPVSSLHRFQKHFKKYSFFFLARMSFLIYTGWHSIMGF